MSEFLKKNTSNFVKTIFELPEELYYEFRKERFPCSELISFQIL